MNLGIFAVTLLLVTSCDDKYPVMWDESVVGLSATSLSVKENATGSFNVYLGGVTGTEATTVTLEVSVAGIAKPAIEGTDFTLSSKSINTPVGVTAVTVSPIDNSIFTGNKQFKVRLVSNSKNYPITAQDSIVVTIVDDEHPLKNWIGSYTVAAASYGSPGAWDEAWPLAPDYNPVTTFVVPGDVTKLSIVGIAGSTEAVLATFNTTDMTISIPSPSSIDGGEGYENTSIYYATDELLAIASGYVTSGMLSAASQPITGTIEANGTIKIDRMCVVLDDYVYAWDCFNTTWTK